MTFTIVCFELKKFTLCVGVFCWQMRVGVLVLILFNNQGEEIGKHSVLHLQVFLAIAWQNNLFAILVLLKRTFWILPFSTITHL